MREPKNARKTVGSQAKGVLRQLRLPFCPVDAPAQVPGQDPLDTGVALSLGCSSSSSSSSGSTGGSGGSGSSGGRHGGLVVVGVLTAGSAAAAAFSQLLLVLALQKRAHTRT